MDSLVTTLRVRRRQLEPLDMRDILARWVV